MVTYYKPLVHMIYETTLLQVTKAQSEFVISGFRREAAENCALLGYHAASSGNLLPTFRDNLSVPSSGALT
jgi:hypothetical protein